MSLRFRLNHQPVEISGVSPTTTLLQWLRASGRVGTKEGCAEGDCGACTVAILDPGAHGGPAWRAVNSCLVLLPTLQGKDVLTVEALAQNDQLHPAQQAMVDTLGSQCGYCTPGFVMSLFEATYRSDLDRPWKLDDQLCGNLCRCTGYRPIRDAAARVAGTCPNDAFAACLGEPGGADALSYRHGDQSFEQPGTLEDLWDAMDAHPQARIVCGATDLGLDVTKKRVRFPALISLEAMDAFRGVQAIDTGWRIGATTRLSDLEAAAETTMPVVARMLRFFASRQIKNRATVGGNLCNASPIGDLAPALLALGATVVLGSRAGERVLPLQDFFLGYRQTALRPGELLLAVELRPPQLGARMAAYKVSKRRELDISAVCAGFYLELDDGRVSRIRIAYGGLAATSKRAAALERALIGKPWTEASVEAALPALDQDFQPIDDHRGSAWYRQTVAHNLVRGFYEETQEQPSPALPDRPSGTVINLP